MDELIFFPSLRVFVKYCNFTKIKGRVIFAMSQCQGGHFRENNRKNSAAPKANIDWSHRVHLSSNAFATREDVRDLATIIHVYMAIKPTTGNNEIHMNNMKTPILYVLQANVLPVSKNINI